MNPANARSEPMRFRAMFGMIIITRDKSPIGNGLR